MDSRVTTPGKIIASGGLALCLAACGGGSGYGGGGGGGSPAVYTVGGTVTGLSTSTGLVLLDDGTDAKTINADGAFTFATPLRFGMTYNVTVKTAPTPAKTCTVTSGSGTIGYSNVTNVVVTCV